MAQMKKDFQRVLSDDAEFKDAIAYENFTLIEAHAGWTGPCEAVKPTLWQIALKDEQLKLATANFDKIAALKQHQGSVKPIYLIYKANKQVAAIDGVNIPEILKAIGKEPKPQPSASS